MVYPMPANTTDIHVYLGDNELTWINYTADYPDAVHHTVLGDWWMIYSVVGPVQNFFVLRIHYEHPIQIVNGSYLFLYNLNISPYLTLQNNNSTCYYTITMKTNFTDLNVYTTGSNPVWKPLNYTITKEGSTQVVSIQEISDFSDNPLPGDMAVTFSGNNQIPEIPLFVVPVLAISTLFIALFFSKKIFQPEPCVKPKDISDRSLTVRPNLEEARNVFSYSKLNAQAFSNALSFRNVNFRHADRGSLNLQKRLCLFNEINYDLVRIR